MIDYNWQLLLTTAYDFATATIVDVALKRSHRLKDITQGSREIINIWTSDKSKSIQENMIYMEFYQFLNKLFFGAMFTWLSFKKLLCFYVYIKV